MSQPGYGQPQWQQPPQPWQPPPAQPASPELRRAGRRALFLALVAAPLAIVAIALPLVIAAAVGCAVGAIVLGIRTLRATQRAGMTTVNTAVAGLTMGALSLLLSGIVTLLLVLLWPQLTDLRDCLTGANTSIAQQACEQTFLDGITGRPTP